MQDHENKTPNAPPPLRSQGTGAADLQSLIKIAVARQNDVLIITAIDGRNDKIVYANAAIYQHSGYRPDEVVGKTPRMFQGPDTSRATRSSIRAAVDAHQPILAEILNYKKDGTPFWTEMNITPILNDSGDATHMVSVQRDVTEKKVMHETMKRRDRRFLLALEASANAIWEWNIATDEVAYRDEIPGRSWHGQSHGRKTGKGLVTFLEFVHPQERKRIQDAILLKLNGTETLHTEEYRFHRPDGSYADVSDRQFILRTADGSAERIIGTILDISDKRSLEDRMPQFQRLEVLGEMTGGIAHNFNNLLTVILGNIDRLRASNLDSTEKQNTIRMIDEAAQRGAALTEHLMSFSQVEKLSLQSIDVRKLVESISPVWRNLLPPEIYFDIRFALGLWPVRTDPVHLEAAILNLVINARDAMPDGGKLSIEIENLGEGADLVRAQKGLAQHRYVMIRVSDNGSGMSPEDLNLAFDPFFTTKPPGKGTGLGLSSAYGFLRQSGGNVSLESNLGQGTTVSIFLLAADTPPVSDKRSKPRHLLKDGGHHVLVVDDDPLVREYVRALLASLEYEISTAATGTEALALLAADDGVDLLFTDILMEGGMNGLELAQQAQSLYPDLPVLFTSAYPDLAEFLPDTQTSQLRILRKPYRARELSIAVLSALGATEAPPTDT